MQTVTELSTLNAAALTGTRGVVLNNVPAYGLPPDFLSALDLYMKVLGGGLLVAGGKQSFGSGGYFQSAVDDLLPVSMELRMEHRKLAVAMAIVVDRSGSMGAGVSTAVTKMDLGNEGASRAIELLGPQDAIAVFAVDTDPHTIIPLTRLGSRDRGGLTDTVRRVTSGGGGIFIYNGLRASWEELQKSSAGQRHLLLFADAADSEEPGDCRTLIDEMTAKGVIGGGAASAFAGRAAGGVCSRGVVYADRLADAATGASGGGVPSGAAPPARRDGEIRSTHCPGRPPAAARARAARERKRRPARRPLPPGQSRAGKSPILTAQIFVASFSRPASVITTNIPQRSAP